MIIPGRDGSTDTSAPLPDYTNPAIRVSKLLTTHVTMVVLAAIVVALRLITRYLVVKNPGWDDYMIIVAMVNGYDPGMSFGLTKWFRSSASFRPY